ncbi:MAG: hypothetical protein Q4C47_05125 [Planctomycetia bacterium]|nr:hypothetical protein [Planctomycetia bacterium]
MDLSASDETDLEGCMIFSGQEALRDYDGCAGRPDIRLFCGGRYRKEKNFFRGQVFTMVSTEYKIEKGEGVSGWMRGGSVRWYRLSGDIRGGGRSGSGVGREDEIGTADRG